MTDRPTEELNDRGFYTRSYADDFLIILRGISLLILVELTQPGLGVVRRWRDRTKL